MGAFNMMEVMRSLDGVSVSIPKADFIKAKSGLKGIKDARHELDAYDLALLLTIAYRQHDRTYDPETGDETNTDINWFCYGSKEALSKISRIKETKFKECRKILIALGFITYAQKEKNQNLDEIMRKEKAKIDLDHLSTGIGPMRDYDCVYRLNWEKLRKYRTFPRSPDDPHPVARRPPTGRHTPPDITYDMSMNNNKGGDVVEVCRKAIAEILRVNVEDVNPAGVRKCCLDKHPKDIIETLVSAAKTIHRGNVRNPVGVALGQIAALEAARLEPETFYEEFVKAMDARRVSEQSAANPDQHIYVSGWEQLVKALDLVGEERNELRTLYTAAFENLTGRELHERIKALLRAQVSAKGTKEERLEQVKKALREVRENGADSN